MRLWEHQLPVLQHRVEHQESRPCNGRWGALREPKTPRQGHKAPPKETTRDAERLCGSAPRIFFKLIIFPVFYVNHLVTNFPTNRAFCGLYMKSWESVCFAEPAKIWESNMARNATNLLPLHHCPGQLKEFTQDATHSSLMEIRFLLTDDKKEENSVI